MKADKLYPIFYNYRLIYSFIKIQILIRVYLMIFFGEYMAGVELGAGTFLNDTWPEEKAAELRNLILEK
jgi:galactose-1-phosphate uridylyltransferase